jgi:hypothetical protein
MMSRLAQAKVVPGLRPVSFLKIKARSIVVQDKIIDVLVAMPTHHANT